MTEPTKQQRIKALNLLQKAGWLDQEGKPIAPSDIEACHQAANAIMTALARQHPAVKDLFEQTTGLANNAKLLGRQAALLLGNKAETAYCHEVRAHESEAEIDYGVSEATWLEGMPIQTLSRHHTQWRESLRQAA